MKCPKCNKENEYLYVGHDTNNNFFIIKVGCKEHNWGRFIMVKATEVI